MIDGSGEQGQSLNNSTASSGALSSAQVISTPAPSENVQSERTFRQSEVNELIGRAKNEAVDRFKRESSIASHTQQQSSYQQQSQQPQQDFRKVAAEEVQRMFDQRVQEQQQASDQQQAERIASEFFTKIEAGKGKFEDFDKVLNDIDLRSIPNHVQLANMVDNTAEVMYELAKNPSKLGMIQALVDIDIKAGRQPKLALAEIKRLSQSIKDNEQAGKYQAPNAPLSQSKPSNAGTGNTGPLSIADYKRKYKV